MMSRTQNPSTIQPYNSRSNEPVGANRQPRKPPFLNRQHSLTASNPMQRRESASSRLGEEGHRNIAARQACSMWLCISR